MERYAWPLILAVALQLVCVEPKPCAAQAQASPTATASFAPGARAQASPSVPAAGRLPSAVSASSTTKSTLQPALGTARSTTAQPLGIPSLASASPGSRIPRVASVDSERILAPRVQPSARRPVDRSVQPTQTLQPMTGQGDVVKLKSAPLDPADLRFPINLATALRLSDARPLIVAAAQASAWVAEAQLARARVLWVPTLMIGFDYIRHDGGGPDFNKGILTAPSLNYLYGGAGLIQNLNLTDAIFQPLAARQVLTSRQWDIQAAKNDALLQTANAYFSVHQYRGMYAGALYSVERGRELVTRITTLSKDLVPVVEVDRAKNLLADLEQQATVAREEWRVRSADLTQVLRLDPRAVVVPLEHDHLQITLIDPSRPLENLLPIGLANRPELASNQAMVRAAEATLRREKMRPVLPIVQLNGFQSAGNGLIQAGFFGLGPNSSINQWTGRFDTSIQLVWQLEGFGLGNLARIKKERGEQSKAVIDLFRTQDKVAAEVIEAQARLQSAAARVGQADRSLRTAIITFNGNYEGLSQTKRFGDVLVLVYRPQEVVYSLQLLKVAFDEYFTTVAEYNRSQFMVFHALGYPAGEIASLHPPGELQPVELQRPGYLPTVGEGPPPATR